MIPRAALVTGFRLYYRRWGVEWVAPAGGPRRVSGWTATVDVADAVLLEPARRLRTYRAA